MDFLGIVLIMIGAYLVDSALKNRRPIRTAADILRDPKSAAEILKLANGAGYVPITGLNGPTGGVGAQGGGGGASWAIDPAASTAANATAGATAVAFARSKIGKPYRLGGAGPDNYDCSGLVMRAWEAAGYRIPRTTYEQIVSGSLQTISRPSLPGDLVYPNPGHVQIYTGNGVEIIEAPRTGIPVRVSTLPKTWYMVRRVITKETHDGI